jgi:hypothetical protein
MVSQVYHPRLFTLGTGEGNQIIVGNVNLLGHKFFLKSKLSIHRVLAFNCDLLNSVARNISNTLYCPYGKDAGCLALLNATHSGPAEGRIQQGEVSACPPSASPSGEAGGDTGFLKVIIFSF